MRTLGAGTRWVPEMSPRYLLPVGGLLAVFTPLALVGLAALATNPDYEAPGNAAAVVVLAVSVFVLLVMRTSWRRVVLGVMLGIVLLAVPGGVFEAEVVLHRGVSIKVVVTAAHSTKGEGGSPAWTCDIRRVDGQPLPHATLPAVDCGGQSQVGTTETVIVDPAGWVAPVTVDGWDRAAPGFGVGLIAITAVFWAAIAIGAARRTTPTRMGVGNASAA